MFHCMNLKLKVRAKSYEFWNKKIGHENAEPQYREKSGKLPVVGLCPIYVGNI